MADFFTSKLCSSRKDCYLCRTSPAYRKALARRYDVEEEFECPYGVTESEFEDAEPSAFQRAMNFAQALASQGATVIGDGPSIVPKKISEHRMQLCRACHMFDGKNKCKKCGCSNMKLKVTWASQECPLPYPDKKWGKEDLDGV